VKKNEPEWLEETWSLPAKPQLSPRGCKEKSLDGCTKHEPEWLNAKLSLNG